MLESVPESPHLLISERSAEEAPGPPSAGEAAHHSPIVRAVEQSPALPQPIENLWCAVRAGQVGRVNAGDNTELLRERRSCCGDSRRGCLARRYEPPSVMSDHAREFEQACFETLS